MVPRARLNEILEKVHVEAKHQYETIAHFLDRVQEEIQKVV
jgi:hypothetical protein